MKSFIKSLKRPGNEPLIEAILKGYDAIFESVDLLADAKKYKTINEFIKSQGVVVHHGGDKPIRNIQDINLDNNVFYTLKRTDKELNNIKEELTPKSYYSYDDLARMPAKAFGKEVSDFVVNFKNPKIIDANGKEWMEIYDGRMSDWTNRIIREAIKSGKNYDGIIIKNIEEGFSGSGVLGASAGIVDDYIVLDKNTIKTKSYLVDIWEKSHPEQVKMGDEVLERIFVYKTLLDKNLRKKLFKRDVKSKKAILPDYTKVDEGNGYYTISYSKGSVVKGEILFVTESEMKMLDEWEDRYNRTEETLESGEKAWAYVEKKKYIKKDKFESVDLLEKSKLNEAIGPVYHGTNDKFDKFNLNKTAMGIIWFTDNKETIESGESGASGRKYIMERYLDIPEEKLAGWDLYEKYALAQLVNMGYKGVKLPFETGNNYIVFDPKDIIKKPN